MVIFNANMSAIRDLAKLNEVEDNLIVGIKSGVRSKIVDNNCMYAHPITMKRKKRRDDMDIGMMGAEGSKSEDEESCCFPSGQAGNAML